MAHVARSNREKRRAENQEDIKHLLEEIWDYDPDNTFYKIFSREANTGILCIINRPKEDFMNLKWEEDNGDVSELMTFEVGMIHILDKYVVYLKTKGCFLSEANNMRCNTITFEDWNALCRIQIAQYFYNPLERFLIIIHLDYLDDQEVLRTN